MHKRAPPIIDIAKEPREMVYQRLQNQAGFYFLWLRFLRPLFMALCWLGVCVYAWFNFFSSLFYSNASHVMLVYMGVVGVIAVLIFAFGLLRKAEFNRETGNNLAPASHREVARFADVPEESLFDWQATPSLVVHHKADGHIASALPLLDPQTLAGMGKDAGAACQPAAPRRIDVELDIDLKSST